MSSQTYFHRRRELLLYARKLRQAFKRKNQNLILRFTSRLNAIIAELAAVITLSEVKKLLASAGLIILLSGTGNRASAQSFAPPTLNPFGLTDINNGAWLDFVDIDNDGDLDVFGGSVNYDNGYGEILFFENVGDVNQASFGSPQSNPFGIDPGTDEILMPAFVDIDDDGDQDLMLTYEYGLLFFENTGTASEPQFAAPIGQPFGVQAEDYMFRPNFVDIDNDGDFDLITGGNYEDYYSYDVGIFFYENTGSASAPEFAIPVENPFGVTNGYYFSFPTFADLDDDGDFDLLLGEKYDYYSGSYMGNLLYFENIGTAESPEFGESQKNPFGLTGGYYITYPMFADIDGDGDEDLFVGQVDEADEEFGNFLYFENLGSSSVTPIEDSDLLSVYPSPARQNVNIICDINITSLEVFDALGRLTVLDSRVYEIDVRQLSPGIATLRAVTSDGAVYIARFVVSN